MDTAPSYGYHAGDLGKAEYFGDIMGGNRSTGHFGTGTYFVGDENQISGIYNVNYAKRHHEAVDFSKYNLYKPMDVDAAKELYDFLKGVNYNIQYLDIAQMGTFHISEFTHQLSSAFIGVMFPFDFEDVYEPTGENG